MTGKRERRIFQGVLICHPSRIFAVHHQSARRTGPLQTLDCTPLTAELFEGEVFGLECGAFTGSLHGKPGLFEMAHSGTLLIDEIGERPLPLHAKFLRLLESRSFRRGGPPRAN